MKYRKLLRSLRQNPICFDESEKGLQVQRLIKKVHNKLFERDCGANKQSIVLNTD